MKQAKPWTQEQKEECIVKVNSLTKEKREQRFKEKYGEGNISVTDDLLLKNQQLTERVSELEAQLNKITVHNVALQKGRAWFKRFFTKTFEWVR